jgi:hypothetical protein
MTTENTKAGIKIPTTHTIPLIPIQNREIVEMEMAMAMARKKESDFFDHFSFT